MSSCLSSELLLIIGGYLAFFHFIFEKDECKNGQTARCHLWPLCGDHATFNLSIYVSPQLSLNSICWGSWGEICILAILTIFWKVVSPPWPEVQDISQIPMHTLHCILYVSGACLTKSRSSHALGSTPMSLQNRLTSTATATRERWC